MNNEKEKGPTSEELLKEIIGEPEIPGFRKGMTKKKLLKSLSEKDWEFLDAAKAADDRLSNKYSYFFFIKSDQMYSSFEQCKRNCYSQALDLEVYEYEISQSEIDISLGKTDQKTSEGRIVTIKELELANKKKLLYAEKVVSNLRNELQKLFTYAGRMGLDRKVFFTEEDYNNVVKDILLKTGTTRFKVFEE